MVKSYIAPQKQPPKFVEQAMQVKDFMTRKLITFTPNQSMHEVLETLVEYAISGAPVIDEKGELCGVISEGDCLKQVVRGKYLNSPQMVGMVNEYMTADPIYVAPNENIMEVAQKFLNLRLRRFPVLDQGKLVGQISQRDVMAAINKLEHERWR